MSKHIFYCSRYTNHLAPESNSSTLFLSSLQRSDVVCSRNIHWVVDCLDYDLKCEVLPSQADELWHQNLEAPEEVERVSLVHLLYGVKYPPFSFSHYAPTIPKGICFPEHLLQPHFSLLNFTRIGMLTLLQ